MAVQKHRTTPSRRNKRRTHDALGTSTISTDKASGERHLRHHVSKDGFYRGRQAIVRPSEVIDFEDEE